MTLYSGNGWVASPDLEVMSLVPIHCNGVTMQVRSGDVFTLLNYVVQQLNERVEPLTSGGGYNFRANVNDPSSLSNHASGTAVDYNPGAHPNAVKASSTWTPIQIAQIELILAECGGVIRWGGDYHGTPDAMHFEINADPVAVAQAAAKLGGRPGPGGGLGGSSSKWLDPLRFNLPAGQRIFGNPTGAWTGNGEFTVFWAATGPTLWAQRFIIAAGAIKEAAPPTLVGDFPSGRMPVAMGVGPDGGALIYEQPIGGSA